MTGDVFPDWLASRAATDGDRVALSAEGKKLTFSELNEEAARMARRLASLGVKSGDRVASLLHNGLAAAILPHAALRLGATLVPLNVRLTERELDWQLADAAPRVLVGERLTLGRVQSAGGGTPSLVVVSTDRGDASPGGERCLWDLDEADVQLRDEHPAEAILAVIYTSGTTGLPKGAMLTVANFWWNAIGSALNLGVHTDDLWLVCMPLFHVGGLAIVLRSAIYGTAIEVHDGFDANAVNAAIDRGDVTMISVVSVMLERMLDARGARQYPKTLRCVLLGGGPLSQSLLGRSAAVGVPVVPTYGLTESCSQVATLSQADASRRSGAAGRALYPNRLRIDVTPSSDGESDDAGEILVRGPVVMAGYLGKPDETARVIVNGWLHTGDIGRLDADGYLYVLDRRDDLIVTGGENVYPAEVEAVIASHPSVEEAGVIGIADSTWGQRVFAIVKCGGEPKPSSAELSAHCEDHLARFKIPSVFHFTDEPLPRTASGKLRRSALRDIVRALI